MFLVVFVLAAAAFALWLAALISALVTSQDVWISAGQSKLLWLVVIVFLHFIGAFLYLTMARPALRRGRPDPA